MLPRSRSGSIEKSRIPISKKRSSSTSKSDQDGARFSNIQPKQSLASASRQQGSICSSASNQRGKLQKDYGGLKDIRPIGDKAFQERAKAELIRFLMQHNLPERVLKNLRYEYKTIIDLLCSSLGLPDGYNLGSKAQDSMPALLSVLDYPKSHLNSNFYQTIGAMHTWPNLLAIMDWLRTVAELNHDTYKDILEGFPYVNREFFKHDLKCYLLFLNGKDDFKDELGDLERVIRNDRNVSIENDQLEIEILELEDVAKSLSSNIDSQNNEVKKLETDSKNMSNYINRLSQTEAAMARDIDMKAKDIEQLKNQIQSIDDNINALTKEVEGREAVVRRQGQLGFDVQKLQSEFQNAKSNNVLMQDEISKLKVLIENNHKTSTKTTENIREIIRKLQQSMDITSLLTPEEEHLIFNLTLIVSKEPQKARSIKKVLDRIAPQVNEERKKMDDVLAQEDLQKIKHDVAKIEEEVHKLGVVKERLEKEALNMEERFMKEVMESEDRVKEAQIINNQITDELQSVIKHNQLLNNEIQALELKNAKERQMILDGISKLARLEKQESLTIKKIIERSNEIMVGDRFRIRGEVANLKVDAESNAF